MGHAREEFTQERLRPASDAILDELKSLRDRAGISAAKIRDRAPNLQFLRLVEDHRMLAGFNPGDRHLAAYKAIGCTLDHAIQDDLWRTILILSMRYDYTQLSTESPTEWRTIARGSTLDARHELTRALLRYSRSRYLQMMNLAYDELASQLVMRDESPCRGPEDEPRYSKRQVEASMAEMATMMITAVNRASRELYAACAGRPPCPGAAGPIGV